MKSLLLAFLVTLSPIVALAHSEMQQTTPADGAVLTELPAEIALNFADKLRLTAVKAHHSDGETQAIDLSSYKSFADEFVLPMPPMGDGSYEIEWRGLGMDGHAMQGTFSFEVQ
ncbi:copper resistance CopC family protein [Roseovarius sp. CAU 1744]|uniref:copper resistance CopC family protein n=1 Tax=Roseovarius sp. CAU 1744 TaxID=3140368 RepID=UPI00325A8262